MTGLFSALLFAAALGYAGLMGLFAFGYRRVYRQTETAPTIDYVPSVSVIVPARNEASVIEACVRSILANEGAPHRFEVIVVDDCSEDGTAEVVRRLQGEANPPGDEPADPQRLRLVRMQGLPAEAAGHKGHALEAGIARARGEVILTTDADCTVGPRWVRAMAGSFAPGTAFVAGPVRYRPGRTLFGHLQALEFAGLVAVGAGGIGLGWPNMCNSANVAYRRAAYEAYARKGGPAGVVDEVLAQHLASAQPGSVRFCADPDALVETDPVLDPRAFWAQRRRWAGTGPRYPRRGLAATVAAVYVFYVLLLASLLALPFAPGARPAVAAALGLKLLSEATILYPACRSVGQAWLLRYFVPEQVLQIPYVVFVGLAAAVAPPAWKGRKLPV